MSMHWIWVSEDGYYIPESEAVAMTGERKPWIVRPQRVQFPLGILFATEEEPLGPDLFLNREFEARQLFVPDEKGAQFRQALAARATFRVGCEWWQHYSWPEMSELDWMNMGVYQ